jgi:hypothetical protein
MKTTNQMKTEIRDKYNGIPDKQVSPGIYLHSVGRKYVTLINKWGYGKTEKLSIHEFYAREFEGRFLGY